MPPNGPTTRYSAVMRASTIPSASRFCPGLGGKLERTKLRSSGTTESNLVIRVTLHRAGKMNRNAHSRAVRQGCRIGREAETSQRSPEGAPQRVADGGEQFRPAEGLGEDPRIAATEERQSFQRLGVPGDEDRRQPRTRFMDQSKQLEAIHARHIDVRDHARDF